jgi:hypothetical protein
MTWTLLTLPNDHHSQYPRRYLEANNVAYDELTVSSLDLWNAVRQEYPDLSGLPAIITPEGSVYLAYSGKYSSN